jgi:hypothetical protein
MRPRRRMQEKRSFGRVMKEFDDLTVEKWLGKLDAGEKLFPRRAQGVEGGYCLRLSGFHRI